LPAGKMSISSHALCPTSPMSKSPVRRSKLKRHGLRRPNAQISGRASVPTKGLLGGMAYASPMSGSLSTSIRRDLAERRGQVLDVVERSPVPPPSPVPM